MHFLVLPFRGKKHGALEFFLSLLFIRFFEKKIFDFLSFLFSKIIFNQRPLPLKLAINQWASYFFLNLRSVLKVKYSFLVFGFQITPRPWIRIQNYLYT